METIKLLPVNSGNIEKIGYSEESRKLIIKFHNGGQYQYEPVTLKGYNDLINAESIGSFFFKNIRNNSAITTTKLEQ